MAGSRRNAVRAPRRSIVVATTFAAAKIEQIEGIACVALPELARDRQHPRGILIRLYSGNLRKRPQL